jgi:hypothetical protein
MADEQRRAGVLYGLAPFSIMLPMTTRARACRAERIRQELAAAIEGLHALLRPRHIGDDEASVGGDVETGRLNHATVFLADLQNLARRGLVRVHRVHGVAPAIEDEVGAARVLLEVQCLVVTADDVRRKAAGGTKHLDAQRGVGA